MKAFLITYALVLFTSSICAQAPLKPSDGDFIIKDFKFESGETLPELRLHYVTLGTPQKDKNGRVTNAVIVNHGTGGSHTQFLGAGFGGVLFAKGGLLDRSEEHTSELQSRQYLV